MLQKQETEQLTYLFFDVETTGVKYEYDYIVQIAAILMDGSGKELDRMDYIIYPDTFLITNDNAAIHGITHLRAVKEGVKLRVALTHFLKLVKRASYLVAHNFNFDYGFISEELSRESMRDVADDANFYHKEYYCTMQTTTNFVKLNWSEKYKSFKWPRLEQLHWKLFGVGFEGAHNALADVLATARCFFELLSVHNFYKINK